MYSRQNVTVTRVSRARAYHRPTPTRAAVGPAAAPPAAKPADAAHAAPTPAGPPAQPGTPRTLPIVDDDEAVRVTTAMILQDYGYAVIACASGEGALEQLRGHPDISLLLTDVVMPGMDGAQLALHARALRQTLPIVFFSGYTDPKSIAGEVVLEPILRKPFRASELVAQIESALADPRLRR
jgi:two-component system cell cycle sensor histidine kinase/response regulator CckA